MSFNGFTTAFSIPALAFRQINGSTGAGTNTAVKLAVAIACSTLTRVGQVATFTSSAAHHLADRQEVVITGSNLAAFNGRYTITVVSTTVFTYTMVLPDPGANSAGTPVASYTPMAQWALIKADDANAAAISYGPDQNADFDKLGVPVSSVGPTMSLLCVQGAGAKVDLTQFWFKSASANQLYRILFA